MSTFVIVVVIVYGLSILSNLYCLVTLAKKGEPISPHVFGIIVGVGLMTWGIALLAR